jgi:hypothetical protein
MKHKVGSSPKGVGKTIKRPFSETQKKTKGTKENKSLIGLSLGQESG